MRFAHFPAPAMALCLVAACGGEQAAEGTSVPPAATQACIDLGFTPGTAAFARCETSQSARQNSAQRGVMGTLFRDVTMAPTH